MDSDEDYYKTICRVCLCCCEDKNMVPLLDIGGKDGLTCYGIAVKTFANIEIEIASFPYMMCQDCLFLLKKAIKFKKTCENSNETLKRLVQNIGDSSVQTIVSQYVMFSHHSENRYSNIEGKWSSKRTDYTGNSKDNVEALDALIIERTPDTSENYKCLQDNCNSVDNCDDFIEDGKNVSITDIQKHADKPMKDEKNISITGDQKYGGKLLESIEKILESDPAAINSKLKKYPKVPKKRHLNLKQKSTLVTVKNKNAKSIKRKKLKLSGENVKCEVCNMVLANRHTYETHKQRHTGKRFICELCGKAFAIKAFLMSHQAAIHNCGTFFECNICGYKAVRKWDLTEHHRVHTGERPYTCETCGKTFRRQYIWKKHALYHKEKTVQCPKCPRKFFLKAEMEAHFNNIHERLHVYECHECGVTYAKTSTVRRHLYDKHGIEREKQGKIKRINLGRMSENLYSK